MRTTFSVGFGSSSNLNSSRSSFTDGNGVSRAIGALPPIPAGRPAARLSPRVLLSKIEEISEQRTNLRPRQDPHSLEHAASTWTGGFRKDKGRPITHLGESLSARSASGRDNVSSLSGGSRRFGASGELDSPSSSLSPRGGTSTLPSISEGGMSPKAYSKKNLGTLSTLMKGKSSKSERKQAAKEAAQRSATITSCFAMTSDEVLEGIVGLEKHLANKRRTARKTEEEQPFSEFPCLSRMMHAFEESGFSSIPERPREHQVDGIPLGSEAAATSAEVSVAVATFNFYRKLANLSPVKEDKRLTKCAQMLNEVLLPRVPLKLGNQHPRTQALENLGKYLLELLEVKGVQILVLHRTASLKTAMLKCVTAAHMVDPGTVSGQSLADNIKDIRKKIETKEKDHFYHRLSSIARSKCECPDAALLGKLKILWQIAGKDDGIGDLPVEGRSKSSRSTSSGRSSSSRGFGTPRFRTEPMTCVGSPGERNSNLSGTIHNVENAVFWGDEVGALSFRRYLLSCDSKHIGMSRCEDCCILFVGLPELEEDNDGGPDNQALGSSASNSRGFMNLDAPNSGTVGTLPTVDETVPDPTVQNQPEVICFPSPGIFPIEYMQSPHIAWTIMPSTTLYQPTQFTQVEMWQVRITNENGTATAERIRPVEVRRLQVDCSARGNPFCVAFQPCFAKLDHGDQFEVLLSGLTGKKTELNFFHEFQSFRKMNKDKCLLQEAEVFTSWLANMDFWREATVTQSTNSKNLQKNDGKSNNRQSIGGAQDENRRSTRHSIRMDPTIEANRVDNIEIGLVSHPKTTFTHSEVDLTICIHAPGAIAIQSAVYIVRAAVRAVEVPRASYVRKIADRFFIRIKLPMANTRYEMRLKASGPWAPLKLESHPLVYTIMADETVPNLLMSLDHPLVEKYGFTQVQNSMMYYGVTVIAPCTFRLVNKNHIYFLLHVDRKNKNWPTDPPSQTCGKEPGPSLFSSRLPDHVPVAKKDALGESGTIGSQTKSLRVENKRDQLSLSINALTTFYSSFQGGLSKQVQESDDDIHIDIVLGLGTMSSTAVQLSPRSDFPDLFEGFILFADEDAGSKVEAFIRFPREQKIEYQPHKLAEWLVVRPEHYPIGF